MSRSPGGASHLADQNLMCVESSLDRVGKNSPRNSSNYFVGLAKLPGVQNKKVDFSGLPLLSIKHMHQLCALTEAKRERERERDADVIHREDQGNQRAQEPSIGFRTNHQVLKIFRLRIAKFAALTRNFKLKAAWPRGISPWTPFLQE